MALRAHISLLAGVGAPMALQLVRARETLAAIRPVADEGALAAVPAQMRAQVRRFPIDLVAVWHVADVLFPAQGVDAPLSLCCGAAES
jgi:hypothetical protein